MSALADGQSDALAHAARAWRDDEDARASWHMYHLIGDVMRSDELASSATRDAAFVAALRVRLAGEPVPLGPAPSTAARPLIRRLGWRAPAAMAAGVAAVAAALVLMRPEAPGSSVGGPQLAGADAAGRAASTAGDGVRAVANSHPSAGGPLVAEGRMIRDARLDAYLRAHQAARGVAPAALPGGGMRNAEIVVVPVPSVLQVAPAGSGPR
ncbi:MAG: sigma-E factor negative regulatory protein [Rubrivivax sp.]|nr:sigma-E factor negative regulatory protein [Rubrivivax sp.]